MAFFVASISLCSTAWAEVQLWTEAGVRYNLHKKLGLQFDQHLRFDENISATKSIMSEVGFYLRPIKSIRLKAGYRYIADPIESKSETYCDSWHRFFASTQWRFQFKRITAQYRLRYQEQFGFPWKKEKKFTAKHSLRNKIKFELELESSFTPFLSIEIFNRFYDPDGIWHKGRFGSGLAYTLYSHKITLFYQLEKFLNKDPDNYIRHIVALSYHFRF